MPEYTDNTSAEERQTMQNAAAAYEYNMLMKLMHVSVSKHLLDEHFTLVWANDYYYDLIGWSKKEYEATFQNQCDRYYINDQKEWEKVKAAVQEALAKKQSGYTLITRLRRKSGDHIWVQFSNSFTGEYVDGCQVAYTVITDIDKLVRMQQEQSITFDNLPGFVAKYQVDTACHMTLLDANERFVEFFGQACWKKDGYVLLSQGEELSAYHLNSHKHEIIHGEPFSFILRVKNQRGEDAWLQMNGACADWQDGKPIYFCIFIDVTDVTELREMQKKMEEQAADLRAALKMAEQANRAKSDFLSRMSHDIRTPMNAIIGMTEIASAHLKEPDRIANCLKKIALSSQHLLGLINDVLDMSVIERGSMQPNNNTVSLPEFMENVVAIIQPMAEARQQQLYIRPHGVEHEQLYCDALRLRQVFINILSNAVKFTPYGGSITLEIEETPSSREGTGQYRFTFTDTGIGMTPEYVEHIFDAFTRERDSRVDKTEGSGLGMAISKKIVDMLGGAIQVQSTPGQGTVFRVDLPLMLEGCPPKDLRLPPLRVLVADDDRALCEYTVQTLEQMGARAEWTDSGEDTVKLVSEAYGRQQAFDAVILDWKMPKMDGIQAVRTIREKIGSDVPILVASAYDWSAIEEEASAAGVNGFIAKPFFKSSLWHSIQKNVLGRPDQYERPAGEQSFDFTGRTILLVEDNEINREIAEELIVGTGAVIEAAENGKAALERFAASAPNHYDLIFMDVQMPVMNGLEASRRIRALDRKDAKSVPIIAMTADAFAEDRKAAEDAGMNEHLSKPIDTAHLYQVMDKWLAL